MQRLTVTHISTYRYANPVEFGDHRLMFRPRDSHTMRLVRTGLTVEPQARIRWVYDVFGNSIAIASFAEKGTTLRFTSEIELEHYGVEDLSVEIDDFAKTYPFSYPSSEMPDLARLVERQYGDPEHRVDDWTKQLVARVAGAEGGIDTWALLKAINSAIKEQLIYRVRNEEGTQTPMETLQLGGGSCRDYALLFMEAARSLGMATKFVTGYLYTPAADDPAQTQMVGACSTHAWAQVYLPGPGWVEFDPTNDLIGGTDLIRVAVVRDPSQAVPLSGTFTGAPADFLGMDVEVRVSRKDGAAEGTPLQMAG